MASAEQTVSLPDETTLLRAVESAVQAPSVYNSQPWRWRIDRTTGIDLFADRDRHLITIDAGGRDLLLSCGAALQLLVVALAGLGWSAQVDRFPDPENSDHLARVQPLDATPAADLARLAPSIPLRRTDRRRFGVEPVDPHLLDALVAQARGCGADLHIVTGDAARARLIATISRSASLQRQQAGYGAELARWTGRYSAAADGIVSSTVPAGIDLPGDVPVRRFTRGALNQPARSLEHTDALGPAGAVRPDRRPPRHAARGRGDRRGPARRHRAGALDHTVEPAAGGGRHPGLDHRAHRRGWSVPAARDQGRVGGPAGFGSPAHAPAQRRPRDASPTVTAQTLRSLPRALDDNGLRNRLAGRRPAVFLDYDGVLTPIVDRPEDALISDGMRDTVRALARRCPVCVVSGRDRQVVQTLMGIDDLVVAGSHGFDIWSPTAGTVTHDAGSGYEDLVADTTDRLRALVATILGVVVEPKHASVAVHYRLVAPAEHARVADAVDVVLAERPDELRITPGKMVYELQPKIDWDKGRAVLYLLAALDLDAPDVAAVYLGDDITDEDAFRALRGRGIGIIVGRPDDLETACRDTAADLVLASPAEVQRFLSTLAR
jgi:trehalose 6-phosphate phosphatase